MKKITLDDLQPGTETHYTGDMANPSGDGRVVAVHLNPRFGDDVEVELDAQPDENGHEDGSVPARTFRISPANFSRGPGCRFWLRTEWIEKKRADYEAMLRGMPSATDERIVECLAEFDKNHQANEVKVNWDETDPQNPGWYAEVLEGGELITDSVKMDFPVDLDEFPRDDTAEMWAVLKAEFPGHEIVIKPAPTR